MNFEALDLKCFYFSFTKETQTELSTRMNVNVSITRFLRWDLLDFFHIWESLADTRTKCDEFNQIFFLS